PRYEASESCRQRWWSSASPAPGTRCRRRSPSVLPRKPARPRGSNCCASSHPLPLPWLPPDHRRSCWRAVRNPGSFLGWASHTANVSCLGPRRNETEEWLLPSLKLRLPYACLLTTQCLRQSSGHRSPARLQLGTLCNLLNQHRLLESWSQLLGTRALASSAAGSFHTVVCDPHHLFM